MKYPVKIYSKSLAQALVGKKEKDQEKILSNFVSLVKKNRDGSKLKKILEDAELIYLKKVGRDKIMFEFARPNKNNLKFVKSVAKEGDVVQERINSELIAGVKIIVNGEKQFDYSLANKIKNI
jgi:F0F1-type ATP synthase delta subunit